LRKKLPRHGSGGSQATHIDSLKEELESIHLPQPEIGGLENSEESFPRLELDPGRQAKLNRVLEILDRIGPASVLDVGTNRGWYALAAATRGASIVAIDTDSTGVSRLYSDAVAQSLSVLPLIMDFRNPSPARGLCGELCPAAWDRLGCDLVLALAMVHHLALLQRLTFDHIIASLRRFTKRCLLVEFPTPEDYMVKKLIRTADDWYTSGNFQGALARCFRKVEHFPSNTDTRELYFCEI
jgi:cyclopropane fatty-acyl-phospholipid synthase-like methyltransferase